MECFYHSCCILARRRDVSMLGSHHAGLQDGINMYESGKYLCIRKVKCLRREIKWPYITTSFWKKVCSHENPSLIWTHAEFLTLKTSINIETMWAVSLWLRPRSHKTIFKLHSLNISSIIITPAAKFARNVMALIGGINSQQYLEGGRVAISSPGGHP